MNRDVIFLRGTASGVMDQRRIQNRLKSGKCHVRGESERVPLEVGNLGAAEEDVLTGTSSRLFLLDLQLHDIGRVLNDLVDVSPVTRANLTENTLVDPDNTTDKPVTLLEHVNVMNRSTLNTSLHTQKTPIVLNEQ